MAGQLIKDGLARLTAILKLADELIGKPRISPSAEQVPHIDDRPDPSVFTALISQQNDIIGTRRNAENELTTLLENAVAHQN